jgi:hypothetical protein
VVRVGSRRRVQEQWIRIQIGGAGVDTGSVHVAVADGQSRQGVEQNARIQAPEDVVEGDSMAAAGRDAFLQVQANIASARVLLCRVATDESLRQSRCPR